MSDELKGLEETLNEQKMKMVGFEFRVDNLEKQLGTSISMLEKLDDKMDSILEKLSVHSEQNALASQSLEMFNKENSALLKRIESLEKQLLQVQVSVAKLVAYGAGGGAIVTGAVQIIKMMGGA